LRRHEKILFYSEKDFIVWNISPLLAFMVKNGFSIMLHGKINLYVTIFLFFSLKWTLYFSIFLNTVKLFFYSFHYSLNFSIFLTVVENYLLCHVSIMLTLSCSPLSPDVTMCHSVSRSSPTAWRTRSEVAITRSSWPTCGESPVRLRKPWVTVFVFCLKYYKRHNTKGNHNDMQCYLLV